MTSIRRIILSFTSVSIISLFWLLLLAKSALAVSLDWHLSYPSANESTAIRIAPSNSSVVYASIRKWTDYDILRSDNAGVSWQSVKDAGIAGTDVNWISVYKLDSRIVAISIWDNGAFISTDSGTVWKKIFDSPTPRSIEISPSDPRIIYLGIGGGNSGASGIWKTTDLGQNWTKFGQTGSGNNAQITIDLNNADRVFADSDPNYFRTTDAGLTWNQLPLYSVFANTVIDRLDSSLVYTSSWADPGIFVSSNGGNSWTKVGTTTINSRVFRLTQDSNGDLYASRYETDGGVWKSTDGGLTWNNIAHPLWSSEGTWGIDAKNGRIIVGVQGAGHGIYYADTNSPIPTPTPTPTPPPGPRPVVFIPGFGGSWSYKGLFLNQPTNYNDWVLTPIFTDSYYGLLQAAIPDLFTFGYDFRKSIADSALSLNNFLTDKLPGQKANVIGHSMGGLVARYCFQKIPTCADKINKIITGGAPNFGSLDAYEFWEGDQFTETDLMIKFAEDLVLHLSGLPTIRGIDIIHNKIPGARDLLPIFNYITGKPYSALSSWGKNPKLESLQPPSPLLNSILTALSGTGHQTSLRFDVTYPNIFELLTNTWVDGKPTRKYKADGDGTVLKTSSEVLSATNKYYPVWHSQYFGNQNVIHDVETIFGLPITAFSLASTPPLQQMGIIYTLDDAVLTVTDQNGNPVGTPVDGGRVVFIEGPRKKYHVSIQSNSDQKVRVHELFEQIGKPSFEREHDENGRKGEKRKFDFD